MKKVVGLWFMLCLVGLLNGFAQEGQDLADEYFKKGEVEKAYTIYQKLIKPGANKQVMNRYVESAVKLDKIGDAEKVMRRLVKSDDKNPYVFLQAGILEESRKDSAKAEVYFNKAISVAGGNVNGLAELAQDFSERNKQAWSVKILKKAREQSKDPVAYAGELARLYGSLGQKENMVDELLQWGLIPGNRDNVQAILQDNLKENDQKMLETVLYKKVQESPNEMFYTEMLVWYLTQKKEFYKAFIQERALDKRLKLTGVRVYDLGAVALQNKDYKNAAAMFEYVAKEYPQGQLYPFARRLVIKAREEQVKNTYPVDNLEIRKLIADYQKMFQELGKNNRTLEALRSTANLYAFYLDEKDTAITILQLATEIGKTERTFIDRCKLDMGDIYLLKGEPWEATLLYSQVEKSQKEDLLGYEAKLRNARLHYYKGDFELSKEVLDILKQATSREIANDAGALSLLIMDNTGMDSSETAMKEYASIELMLFQNKVDSAALALNQMYAKYKDHSLADNILWLRANTLLKQNKTDEALQDLEKISANYGEDVLGDDALFLTAKTYEENRKDKTKAMELYNQLLQKYPGSIFGAEARKRFRALRGDIIN
ncbi:tetratricopeptide repeat protein [Larkinella arboricola]|uniref:Tetratricopeptide repeat protein n=1 Tax=Larkinella arboricola TaxID=643671 RepID=A0A327WY64_LARAB|nr:tetratricopeptide repeat protein [Larkinella arboricola]RAJ98247.1 tetratricopeptide repeat protein [Larkinella arboricola]